MNPLSHQVEAINYIVNHDNIPLFDEQGLGKSKIVIDALCKNIEDKIIDGAFIICKKTLLYNWKNEIDRHSHLFSVIMDGSKGQRGRKFITFSHFYIVNYETVIQELELITLLLKNKKFALVLDESQKIKNPTSKITNTILSLRSLARKRIILTGTPIANRPEDIWSQFFFLDGGTLLGNDYISFKRRYGVELKGVQDTSKFEINLQELRDKIQTVAIRRTKDVLTLPEKRFEEVYVNLSAKQNKIYELARKEMYYEIQNMDGEQLEQNIDNYLVKLLRLTQIASNPGLLDLNYKEEPAKFIKLDKLVNEIIQKNEKVIIWTSFTGNVRTLRNRYKRFGAQMLFGELLIIERNQIVKMFLEDKKCNVLIANPAAAKEGLTLTSANNAIYVDRTFKMDDYLQSQDRIHRIGQKKICNIIKIIAKNTIDQYTDEILEKKESIAKYTLGDTDKITKKRQYLSKEDLIRILGG
jgi:SNF2 family DNA or RNA helicase